MIVGLSAIIISQNDIMPRLKNKLFPNTNKETSKRVKKTTLKTGSILKILKSRNN